MSAGAGILSHMLRGDDVSVKKIVEQNEAKEPDTTPQMFSDDAPADKIKEEAEESGTEDSDSSSSDSQPEADDDAGEKCRASSSSTSTTLCLFSHHFIVMASLRFCMNLMCRATTTDVSAVLYITHVDLFLIDVVYYVQYYTFNIFYVSYICCFL